MFKVIVAGGRNFNNYETLETTLDHLLSNKQPKDIIIVSGGAKGADALGEQYAVLHNIKVKIIKAKWYDMSEPCVVKYKGNQKYNALAGHLRNKKMAKFANALVAFWDGISPGTKDMIQLAVKHDLHIRVVNY
jgi:glycerophosphoryl diester phosphodiesterase